MVFLSEDMCLTIILYICTRKRMLIAMRLNQDCRLREMAGENVIIRQGKQGADLTKIITLNSSAAFLWRALVEKDFDVEQVAAILVENFEVDNEVALADARRWVERMQECGLVV